MTVCELVQDKAALAAQPSNNQDDLLMNPQAKPDFENGMRKC